MKPLRILITNWTMSGRHGSVMYIRDLAMELFRRGQQPVVYAHDSGEVAQELINATIPVVTDLRSVTTAPDVIIGNSHPDMMSALLHFPGVPGIFVCHAWDAWLADAPRFPRLRRYVAVDETCRDWLVSMRGISEERVRIIYNGVDPARFPPREPLPDKPARAVVFSNYVNEANGLGVIRAGCERAGISLDVIGSSAGQPVSEPGDILRRYDIVFAKARCALEAMTVGCAVITCDYGRLGCMVTSQNWPELRRMNFGRRAIRNRLDMDGLCAEIAKYNRDDARNVSRCIRDVASLGDEATAMLALCHEAITEHARVGSPGPEAEARAAAEYIRTTSSFRETLRLHGDISHAHAQSQMLREHAERVQRELESTRTKAASLEKELIAIQKWPPFRLLQQLATLSPRSKRAAQRNQS